LSPDAAFSRAHAILKKSKNPAVNPKRNDVYALSEVNGTTLSFEDGLIFGSPN